MEGAHETVDDLNPYARIIADEAMRRGIWVEVLDAEAGEMLDAGARVVTMDALLTQRHVAQTIVDEGGDDVMIVTENQPQLRADIALGFTLPPAGDRQETARTVDIGHGRIEQRNATTSEALVGYSDWPGLAQVFE